MVGSSSRSGSGSSSSIANNGVVFGLLVAFDSLNPFTLSDLKRPRSRTPWIDFGLMIVFVSLMIAFTAYVVIQDQNAPNVDTTTTVADLAPDNRIFTVAVQSPDTALLNLYDYSSAACNQSIGEIRVGVDPSEGGIGTFGHSSRMFQYPSVSASGVVEPANNDFAFSSQPMNWYLQPVPSPYNRQPNDMGLDNPNNWWGYQFQCWGYDDPASGYSDAANISYCFPGNPWLDLGPNGIAPTNPSDGVLVNAFDIHGSRPPQKPYNTQPAIGGFRQCESNGTDGSGAPYHLRFGLAPLCFLSRPEQDDSCISDPNGQILDYSNHNNRCRERGIYRFGLSYYLEQYAQNVDGTPAYGVLDEFGAPPQIWIQFLDSDTNTISPDYFDLHRGAAYYFTYQLTVVDDYTQTAPPPVPTDLKDLCGPWAASTDSTAQRPAGALTRYLTLVSVEQRLLYATDYTRGEPDSFTMNGDSPGIENYIYVYIGILPNWYHREIKSGQMGTLAIMAQLGGALTTVFTLLRAFRMILKFFIELRNAAKAANQNDAEMQTNQFEDQRAADDGDGLYNGKRKGGGKNRQVNGGRTKGRNRNGENLEPLNQLPTLAEGGSGTGNGIDRDVEMKEGKNFFNINLNSSPGQSQSPNRFHLSNPPRASRSRSRSVSTSVPNPRGRGASESDDPTTDIRFHVEDPDPRDHSRNFHETDKGDRANTTFLGIEIEGGSNGAMPIAIGAGALSTDAGANAIPDSDASRLSPRG